MYMRMWSFKFGAMNVFSKYRTICMELSFLFPEGSQHVKRRYNDYSMVSCIERITYTAVSAVESVKRRLLQYFDQQRLFNQHEIAAIDLCARRCIAEILHVRL